MVHLKQEPLQVPKLVQSGLHLQPGLVPVPKHPVLGSDPQVLEPESEPEPERFGKGPPRSAAGRLFGPNPFPRVILNSGLIWHPMDHRGHGAISTAESQRHCAS